MFKSYAFLEMSTEPPEDKRRVVDTCAVCGEDIREGDEAYGIPSFGYVCAKCISDAYVMEVED